MATFIIRYLRNLFDVDTTGAAPGDVLELSGDGVTWVPGAGGGGGGAPTTATYLTGTADATLTNEIVVGPTPGGELGNTWVSPTVDTVHSGSSHAQTQAAAEATAAAALLGHTSDPTDAHDASAISFVPVGTISATDVQAAIAEAAAEASDLTGAVILAPASSARNVIVPTNGDTIAAIIRSHADWETGLASGDMLDFQDENGVLMAGFFREQGTDIRQFFIYDDVNQDVGAFFSSVGWTQYVRNGATFPPIHLLNQDGSATLFKVLPSGAPVICLLTAPANGDLAASQIAEWFDSTNGAAKFMLKGKTANGTVVTWTIPNGVVYVVGGTDVALADGGTGASLTDPNADRIMFWDDSAGAVTWLTAGTGLTITGTTIDAAASGAPSTATYITQTADGGLSAEQALSALATGLVKNTTGTGVLSIGAAGTDYYAPGGTDVAVTDGGTGASTAAAAVTNLGIWGALQPIGTRVDIYLWQQGVAQTNFNTSIDKASLSGAIADARQSSGAQNAEVTYKVNLAAGTWTFNLLTFTGANIGIYTISVDGVSQGTIDGYSAGSVTNVAKTLAGMAVLTNGVHDINIKMATKNGSSSSYFGELIVITLERTA